MDARAEGLPELFMSWEMSASLEDELSFGVPGSGGNGHSLWVADLPAEPEAAAQALDRQESYLQQSRWALDAAPMRAESLVQSIRTSAAVGVSFDAVPAEAMPLPESEALRILSAVEGDEAGAAFGLGDFSISDLKSAEDRFRQVVERTLQLVSHQAWVDTRTGGAAVGRTIVGWGGDMHTIWSETASDSTFWMHQRSVSQALKARAVQMHAVVVTTTSAAKLGVLLSNPAGAILALPAAWKLVEQILADIDQYKQIKSQEI